MVSLKTSHTYPARNNDSKIREDVSKLCCEVVTMGVRGGEISEASYSSTIGERNPEQIAMAAAEGDDGAESASSSEVKDPRSIARKYQLELCRKAVEENVIVYLGTGCGKTLIAVLLMYELKNLIRKPQKEICVFLAPTVHLVRQQAMVIEKFTDFRVGSYWGHSKHLKSHQDWDKEIEKYEVLVMTPQILLHNLFHRLIKMELIALLIFDECHHAQAQSSHPYTQIMKEYKDSAKRPRIFGMTASPIVGKGALNQENLPKGINSLESLLDAKVYTVDDREELETFVSSPNVKVYYYNNSALSASNYSKICIENLEHIKQKCIQRLKEKTDDLSTIQNNKKMLQRLHNNLIFCLENLGLLGTKHAVRIYLNGDESERIEMIETEGISIDNSLEEQYLKMAASFFDSDFMMGGMQYDFSTLEGLKEPVFSNKLLVLIEILSTFRQRTDSKCIIFVNRIIVARSLSCILENINCLEFWKCHFLIGFHSGLKNVSRKHMNSIVEKFRSDELNLLIATKVGEEGLDIQTCCLVIRFDLPETGASFIQSRGRARMVQSEYAFLVESGNQNELDSIENFISDENRMNKEIMSRTSSETFDCLVEDNYKVCSTGASINAGYSVSLLHRYCSKLPHDEYFNPKPEFYFFDDSCGTMCHIILPSNAPIHEVLGPAQPSKDKAKKIACLKACEKLHLLGFLTDHLLPCQDDNVEEGLIESDGSEDDNSRGELHEMKIPAALKVPWNNTENVVLLHVYFIRFIPVPEDRQYQEFGLFIKAPLPSGAETMELDLHLAHGRIVKTKLVPEGITEFDKEEIMQAENFQELFLKVILDRSVFFSDFVQLGKNASSKLCSSTFYLLLPVRKNHGNKLIVDWMIIRSCLSSPVFQSQIDMTDHVPIDGTPSLVLANGPTNTIDIVNSLVFTAHNKLFFFVVEILHGTDAESPFTDHGSVNYIEHYAQKFGINLTHPKQPLLKAKQLFSLRNLLHNRVQENTATRELVEHFVELPPELCSLKIIGFTKAMGSSLSLLPSIMHRLENLLVAIELKGIFSAAFAEGLEINDYLILEALTTEKCLERFSIERLEVLGDAFLKFVVGRHLFLLHDTLDEGQLTWKRSSIVNNTNLYRLATKRNLQVFIRDEHFDPSQFFAFGHPCTVVCNKDTEASIHMLQESHNMNKRDDTSNIKCSKAHQWLHRKTIADVVEALVGALLVDSGFKAAISFLKWIGIQVDFEPSKVFNICSASKSFMSLPKNRDMVDLEKSLNYRFRHKGLLVQAFVHPSYNKHSGGCYQRLEFLGDAVLDYLITSYLYSVYPKLKPGQLTDLRSACVNNNSFANVAVCQGFHKFLISDSDGLSKAVKEFVTYSQNSGSTKSQMKGPPCPKVLGDLVESCVGAILLDSGFNLNLVWEIMLSFLHPIMSFSSLPPNPIRNLQELCQCQKWELEFSPSKKHGNFVVKAEVIGPGIHSISTNFSKKAAKRAAAEEIFLKLKDLGYRLKKNKSLEEVLKLIKKQQPTLIGFNEAPVVAIPDSSQLGNLETHDGSSSRDCSSSSTIMNKEPQHRGDSNFKPSRSHFTPLEASHCDHAETSEAGSLSSNLQMGGGPHKGSAKAQLFEICVANSWNPPFFECIKEEGPCHLKLFQFRVRVKIDDIQNTILECSGEPRATKKGAKDHAAEGALWYLKHLGCLKD